MRTCQLFKILPLNSFLKDFYLFILERGEGWEEKRVRNIVVREKH